MLMLIANPLAASTTLIMPASNALVLATYKRVDSMPTEATQEDFFKPIVNKVNPSAKSMEVTFRSLASETANLTVYNMRGEKFRELKSIMGRQE